ncbi:sulfate ABC transporter permease subunit CysT [Lysinibacillus sp. fkY74-1]|uniref:Sulfate transport system permease protein CysT n=3 Tax=Lysinibacillus TaxID=400634 RepID=B1HXC4_LYSSC|nr:MULTISPECIES: sulfate ABC transporter permease subunit CysT [Lysinibacillus]MBE5084478.1 sulfate ABC transporter permease subunit CysT [Bacillus thuringiensis]ACA38219.1 Sulfate transport system permease protein [Lysinibacillus sphaericus C3-41]AMO32367.1 sulfate ABC transporter permease subunit CysT [Lysinibacillus sphaericus]AMR92533.1 sulfate ABC transporter permease subunit CysT [Lysinibacillus sphaericus]ANA46582.1 sulfate ABC transporter permease subunit CysT [Lysinibacillus sphaericu
MSSLTLTKKSRRIIPGFHLSLGYTMLYVSLLVLLPLSMIFFHTMSLSWTVFLDIITDPRAVASYKVSFSTALIAGLLNVLFGTIIAWVLVRYQFPFKRMMDGLVDLPFALPTAVAGIALTSLYAPNGWIGQFFDFKIAFTPLGIIIALTFIGLPFVVRTVQPVLQNISAEVEEASASLGANRLQTFRKVILPELLPAILTGFSLAFARALGEYGSVVFIAGNMPMKTEITPLIIMTKLEQYDYAGATAIAVVMLVTSFILLLTINVIQWLANRRFVH